MDSSSMTPQYKTFVEDILAQSSHWMNAALQQTLQQLENPQPPFHELPGAPVRELAELVRAKRVDLAQRFTQALREEVMAQPSDFLKLDTGPTNEPELLELRLMDEAQAEEHIELMRDVQWMEGELEGEMRELQSRVAALRGLPTVDLEANPLRPQALLNAWAQVLKGLDITQVGRQTLMRCVTPPLIEQVKKLASESVQRLDAMGVVPAAYRIVPTRAALRPELETGYDVTRPGALHELLNVKSPGAGPVGWSSAVGAGGGEAPSLGFLSISDTQLEQTLDGLLARLNRLEAGAFGQPEASSPPQPQAHGGMDGTARSQALPTHRVGSSWRNVIRQYGARLNELAQRDDDRRVIAVMSQLFDQIFADPFVPPSIKSLLARLQASALRIALSDPGLFNAHDHPTWQLLNALGSYSMGYEDDQDPRLALFVASVAPIFDHVAQSPAPDAALHANCLAQVLGQIAQALSLEQQGAGELLQRLESRESKLVTKSLFQEQVARKLQGVSLSPVLQRFLALQWVRVLVESSLPDYEGEVPAQAYWDTLKDLLASLQPASDAAQRRQLRTQLPTTIGRLRQGMQLIKVPEPEQHAVLEELMRAHQSLLKGPSGTGSAGAEGELSAEEIVQRMREESVTNVGAMDATSGPDTLIDVSSLETVPADLETKMAGTVEWTRRLSLGSWTRLFTRGHWAAVRLIWRSNSGQYLLFGTPLVDHPLSLTQGALEQLAKEGLARPLEIRSLFERAVDAMVAQSG